MNIFDKKVQRNINDVKRGVKNLRKLGFKVEGQETETMTGQVVKHIYVTDTIGDRVCFQKHLLTLY